MNRYKIHNLQTGERYEFTDDAIDTTLEDRLNKKAKVYGHRERAFPAERTNMLGDVIATIIESDGELRFTTPEIPDVELDGQVLSGDPSTDRPLSEVHPDWYATGTPTLDGDEVVVPAQHTIEIESLDSEIEAKRIEKLWNEANEIALQFDHNSRAKALSWKVDGSPQWRTDRIAAIDAWMDSIWSAYYAAVATPGATTIGEITEIPYTFSDLLAQ